VTFKGNTAEQNLRIEEATLHSANQSLILVIGKTLEIVVENCVKKDFDAYFFYLFESADSSRVEDAASRLLYYLDGLLTDFKAVTDRPETSETPFLQQIQPTFLLFRIASRSTLTSWSKSLGARP
jgi:hypothetical protein